jgi:hypothetical protein
MPDHTPPPRWTEITSTYPGPLTVTHHFPERFAVLQPIDDLPELTPHQFATLAEWCYRHALNELHPEATFDPRYAIHWDTNPLDSNFRLYITGYAFRTTLTRPIPRWQWSRY